MIDLLFSIAIIIGIICIYRGKKKSNKVLLYIGVILVIVGVIFGIRGFIIGVTRGFGENLSRP